MASTSKPAPKPKPKPKSQKVNLETEEVTSDEEEQEDEEEDKAEERDHNWDDDIVCVVEGNPYWLVEEIRDVRVDNKGKLMYFVKWVNYPESINSWEPEENCSLARRLIQEFHQKMSEARKHQLGQQMLMKSKPAHFNKPAGGKGVKRIAETAKTVAKRPMTNSNRLSS